MRHYLFCPEVGAHIVVVLTLKYVLPIIGGIECCKGCKTHSALNVIGSCIKNVWGLWIRG